MTKVWLAYKEPTDREYDYELIDLDELYEDAVWKYGDPEYDKPDFTEANVTKCAVYWMNDRGSMIAGDRWFGDPGWEWHLMDRPPLNFLLDEMRSARVRSEEYAQEAYDLSIQIIGYYPDVMGNMGGHDDDQRDRTSEAED